MVAVIRGGGSRTDLMAFDTLDLAKSVALHPVKVVVGIGHHADRSVLDELAHSEKTPTAVGQYLVSRVQESWDEVVGTAESIVDRASALIEMETVMLVSMNFLSFSTARAVWQELVFPEKCLKYSTGTIKVKLTSMILLWAVGTFCPNIRIQRYAFLLYCTMQTEVDIYVRKKLQRC